MELLLDPDINILSLSSSAGYGKTHIAVAGALHSVLQKKLFKKIYVFKTVEDIGPSIGFLPGSLQEKIDPYMKYIKTMFQKLHEGRKGNNDLFLEDGELNPKYVEVLPLTYIRGMNIDDAYVIIDEAQNISRLQMRSLLTRMGDNVKVILCGDPNQVDNPNLNSQNNGLNWCVRLFKGEKNYGHITLGGSKSRGPICDLVHKKGL
jgi:PhoH-like ATPase